MLRAEMLKQTAEKIAWAYIGTPYKWGGDDPMAGFDCSGFVVEILKSVGTLSLKGDWTAQGLWDRTKDVSTNKPRLGCLVFWKTPSIGRVYHVEFCLNDELSIGAGGGGSMTETVQDAIDQNAYVRVRPFLTRSGIRLYFSNPFEDPFVGG